METTHLLFRNGVRLAPGAEADGRLFGPISKLAERPLLDIANASESRSYDTVDKLRQRQAKWAQRKSSQDELATELKAIRADDQGRIWLRCAMEGFWEIHRSAHGALFDLIYLNQIAKVLDVPRKELKEIWNRSRQESVVASWIKSEGSGNEVQVVESAYVVAALIRGRVHDRFAEQHSAHLTAHPLRRILGPEPRGRGARPYGRRIDVSEAEAYMARIVVGHAVSRRSGEERVRQWIDDILRVRATLSGGQMSLYGEVAAKDPESCAEQIAIKAGIVRYPVWARRAVDAAAGLAIFALSSFLVFPWSLLSLPVSVAPLSIGDIRRHRKMRGEIGEYVDLANRLEDPSRLLAALPAGRVVGE